MKTISMAEFRDQFDAIIKCVQQGQQFVIMNSDKPAARLEPIASETTAIHRDPIASEIPAGDDPFYKLDQFASDSGMSLTNREIDQIVYGV